MNHAISGETVTDLAPFLLHQGTNYHADGYLGAHTAENGAVFRVWAPNASAVSVVGDFCGWEEGLSMRRITQAGIWEASCAGVQNGALYKFRIVTRDGRVLYKADPYARAAELLRASTPQATPGATRAGLPTVLRP